MAPRPKPAHNTNEEDEEDEEDDDYNPEGDKTAEPEDRVGAAAKKIKPKRRQGCRRACVYPALCHFATASLCVGVRGAAN